MDDTGSKWRTKRICHDELQLEESSKNYKGNSIKDFEEDKICMDMIIVG